MNSELFNPFTLCIILLLISGSQGALDVDAECDKSKQGAALTQCDSAKFLICDGEGAATAIKCKIQAGIKCTQGDNKCVKDATCLPLAVSPTVTAGAGTCNCTAATHTKTDAGLCEAKAVNGSAGLTASVWMVATGLAVALLLTL